MGSGADKEEWVLLVFTSDLSAMPARSQISSAPKVPNPSAQGNALVKSVLSIRSPEGGRYNLRSIKTLPRGNMLQDPASDERARGSLVGDVHRIFVPQPVKKTPQDRARDRELSGAE